MSKKQEIDTVSNPSSEAEALVETGSDGEKPELSGEVVVNEEPSETDPVPDNSESEVANSETEVANSETELNVEQETDSDNSEQAQSELESHDDLVPEEDDDREWYILQCYTQQEHKVKEKVEQMITDNLLESKVFRILVPEEETIEIKNNKRIERTSKIFPGYVFVQMILDERVSYEIRNITGVARFIGTKNQPTPVREEEILRVLRKVGDKTKKIDVDFEMGEEIKVISGPFRGYAGPISEINDVRGKLKALISIFGRETPVELEFDQVEKAIK